MPPAQLLQLNSAMLGRAHASTGTWLTALDKQAGPWCAQSLPACTALLQPPALALHPFGFDRHGTCRGTLHTSTDLACNTLAERKACTPVRSTWLGMLVPAQRLASLAVKANWAGSVPYEVFLQHRGCDGKFASARTCCSSAMQTRAPTPYHIHDQPPRQPTADLALPLPVRS